MGNTVLAARLVKRALSEHLACLLDAVINILDAGNNHPLAANIELLQLLDGRCHLVSLLALVIAVMRQIM